MRVRISGWGIKYSLAGILAVLLISTSLFVKTTAAPISHHQRKATAKHSYKIIPIERTLEYKNNQSGSSNVKVLEARTVLNPLHTGLASSSDPQLKKLAEYEQSAGGALASGMMVFTELPSSSGEAQTDAADIAFRLKDFAKFGIQPLVIMEPTNSGGAVNFTNYKNGAYDPILNSYFSSLKNQGVSDKAMGMWVFFPEANLPEWGPVDVTNFAPNVVRTVQIQKKYFPSSHSSIMLDAESYPAGSTDWASGSYTSLLPFINGIPAGLLDSFGLQGFPWAPPANQGGDTSYNPSVYLNANLAAEAAKRLGTANVWLNTGTFATMYTKNKSQTVAMSPAQRQSILNGVLAQAKTLKNTGFSVAVNLFSEDKSNTGEAINWSYKTADEKTVLNNFALQLHSSSIELWLFDD